MDKNAVGKLMGSENGEYNWNFYYNIFFIPTLFFRIARMILSYTIFMLGIFLGQQEQVTIFTTMLWSIVDT